jgi:hypothetical protein
MALYIPEVKNGGQKKGHLKEAALNLLIFSRLLDKLQFFVVIA